MRLLVEAIYQLTGCDFRGRSPRHLVPRLRRRMRAERVDSISRLQGLLVREPEVLERTIRDLLSRPGGLFERPQFYRTLREKVVPWLRTYPFVRIWAAEGSAGEEAYSLAILLEEEGLGPRCEIYATEMADEFLEGPRKGRIRPADPAEMARGFRKSGGRGDFARFLARPDREVRLHPRLTERITFGAHSLVSDASFNEFNLIVCRHALSTYRPDVHPRILDVFHRSLRMFGYLGLGARESLARSPHAGRYVRLKGRQGLYRRER